MNIAVACVGRVDPALDCICFLLRGCERPLRNYMKEEEILVAAVVRSAKVDIGSEATTGAGRSWVHALENSACGNERDGRPVTGCGQRTALSVLFTAAADVVSARTA